MAKKSAHKFVIILTYEGGSHRGYVVHADDSGSAVKKLLDNIMKRPTIGQAGQGTYVRSIECSEILYPPEDIIK